MGPVASRARCRSIPLAVLGILGMLALPATGRGDEPELPDSSSFTRSSEVRDTIPAVAEPFRAGESLRFSVQYGFIHAGTAWLEVPEVAEDANGRRAWRLVARAESNGFFDRVYKVRNRIESLWDQDAHFSWRYFEDRHEGHFTANDTMWYEPDSSRMRYKNGQTFAVPGPVQDALSSFYLTRFEALPIGGRVTFDYHASRKTALMEVLVLGRERVRTPAGTFNCVVVEPLLKAGGIFKNKGRLVIWLTDDARRMPVLMKSKVAIGSVKVVLQEVKTGV
ncbi:MAG TPA: DUF3108 domain-containing protein [Candidatus Eisenbacteria bacterium]